MAREDALLREVAADLDGQVSGDRVALPKQGCRLHVRVVAWRSDDQDVATEWNVRVVSSRDRSSNQGGGPYRDVEQKVLHGRPEIELHPTSKMEEEGNVLGLGQSIETGDELFDAEVYVASDSPRDQVLTVLEDATVRDEIGKLLRAGCAGVDINRNGAELATTIWVGKGAGQLTPVAEGLCRLHAALPSFEGPARRARWREAATTTSLFLPVLGVLLSAVGLRLWEPVHFTDPVVPLVVGFGVWALLIPATYRMCRGRPHGGRTFTAVLGPALFGLPLTLCGAAICVNGAMDSPERGIQRAKILHKDTSHDDCSITLDVGGSVALEVDVDEEFMRHSSEGQEVELVVGRGRFGWPWVDEVRRARSSE